MLEIRSLGSMSSLTRYCDSVMEAAWLCAILCTPLFFNAVGERIQNDKNHLLRSFALILFAAWITKWIASLVSPVRQIGVFIDRCRSPLGLFALILAVIYSGSTVFAVSPGTSFWGTALRRDGSFTTLSCLLIFAALWTQIRSKSNDSLKC